MCSITYKYSIITIIDSIGSKVWVKKAMEDICEGRNEGSTLDEGGRIWFWDFLSLPLLPSRLPIPSHLHSITASPIKS